MPDDAYSQKSSASSANHALRDLKAERLADALRANLKRRKAADRARRDREDEAPPADEKP